MVDGKWKMENVKWKMKWFLTVKQLSN